MSTKENRKYIAESIEEEIIPLCCNGNKSAEDYLKRIFYVVRILDDIYDEDIKVEKKDLTRVFFILGAELNQNVFYKEHLDALSAIHVVGFNAWEDSNEWENENNETKRIYAHVIKDFICELFPMVAFFTGGYKAMRKTSLKVRELFLKEE